MEIVAPREPKEIRAASVAAGSPPSRRVKARLIVAISFGSVIVRGSTNTTRSLGLSSVWLGVV
jgi:hypothetical protein